MTSFREEIQSVLDYISEYGLDCEPYTDKILKLIEKRIDSIMQSKIIKHHKDQYSWESRNIDEIVGLFREIKELLK